MHFGGALHISIGKGQKMQMDTYSSKVLMRRAGVVAWFLCSESRRAKSRWIQVCLDYELLVNVDSNEKLGGREEDSK